MPLKPYPGFCSGTYRQADQLFATDRAINLYPEKIESGTGKGDIGLVGRPGVELFATLGASPGRAIWSGDANELYAVGGGNLYRVTLPGAVVTSRGAVGNDGLPAQILSNGSTQLAVISAGDIYVDNGAGIVPPTTPPPGGAGLNAGFGAFVDGYYLVVPPNTNNIYQSNLFDAMVFDPLNFVTWSGQQDRLAMLIEQDSNVTLLGRRSMETWFNAGNAGFAFQRSAGAASDWGIAAPHSFAKPAGQLTFLARGATRGGFTVVSMLGNQLKRISNHAIEYLISTWGTAATTAVGFAWETQGHQFYQLNCPSVGSVVYDFTSQMWHEEYYWSGSAYAEMLGRFHTFAIDGNHYVLSGATAKLYKINPALFTDEGADIRYERTAPNANDAGNKARFGHLKLDINVGVGANDGGINLEVSRDNGQTFSAARNATTGANTAYGTIVQWGRLGSGYSFVPKVWTVANRRIAIANAYFDATPGTGM